ncbi:MAG: DUF1592 domain-containing protein [Verrucomicrobia bacterium]|nr:DUF1592 domain-containing protein [Verrucomicrobiota bacterium]
MTTNKKSELSGFPRTVLLWTGKFFFLALGLGWVETQIAHGDEISLAATFEQHVGSVVNQYCLDCHSSEKKKGDIDLEVMLTPGQFARFFKEWEWVVEQLAADDMPPKKAEQPTKADQDRMIRSIREEVEKHATQQAGDPGNVLVRRLTQAEYENSVQDLTGIEWDLRAILPDDVVGGEGFANTGEVQFTQESTLERYLEAAHKVAAHTVIGAGELRFIRDPGDTGQELWAIKRIQSIYRGHGFRTGAGEGAEPFGLEMFNRAFLAAWMHRHREILGHPEWSLSDAASHVGVSHKFAAHIAANLSQSNSNAALNEIVALWEALPKPVTQDLETEKKRLRPSLKGIFAKIQSWQKHFAKKAKHIEESAQLDSSASDGTRDEEAVAFASVFPSVSQREPAPSDRDPIPAPYDNSYNNAERNAYHYQVKYHRDDAFLVRHILNDVTKNALDTAWHDLYDSFAYHQAHLNLLSKHFDYELGKGIEIGSMSNEDLEAMPAELRRWVASHVKHRLEILAVMNRQQTAHLDQCVDWAGLAWRRTLSINEEKTLRDFYHRMRKDPVLTHKQAIRTLIARILTSPSFLYRMEAPVPGNGIQPVTPSEFATRLSYFLWSSLPETPLNLEVDSGGFITNKAIKLQIDWMLKDQRASRFAKEFFGQWFGYYRFPEFKGVDDTHFTYWTPWLRASLYQEANLFFSSIVMEDRSIDEILLADQSFLNVDLAKHYGIPFEEDVNLDGGFFRVSGVSKFQRGGLLGLGVVHATTSAPLRTSIVKRGDWILRRVLGTPVPPPPADAGSISTEGETSTPKTMRELLEAHQKEASCVNCHARMDPLGFAMEVFDVTGRTRTHYENGLPVEDGGELPGGIKVKGFDGIRSYLKDNMELFHRTFCTKIIGYALGRKEQLSDRQLIESMMRSLAEGEPISSQIHLLVRSPQFRHKRGAGFTLEEPLNAY